MTNGPTLNILVVDDRPENRLAVAAALECLGERVVLAESGEDALRHLLKEAFALILLDVHMPGMDGFETARMIKAWPKTRNVPLIFTSADPETGVFQARGYALGAVDYLPTPFDPARLRAKAAVFLELARQTRCLREQAAELAMQVRYKDEFLAIVSHELKTPLSAVIGFTELLGEEGEGCLGPEQRGYLAEITAATDRLQTLVNDLLDMGRIQAGRFALHPAPTDLAAVLGEVHRHLEVLIRRKGLHLTTQLDALPELMIDPERVRQVLLNLLTNAIKFTPEGGRLAVRVKPVGGMVRVSVTDTGPGIPASQQARIFERFGQVDTTATRGAGGTGLGLSIAKAIVEAHGGRIGVESRPGHGSTFWFTLPKPKQPRARRGTGAFGATARPAAR
jgi:signal transduction histidine kinase